MIDGTLGNYISTKMALLKRAQLYHAKPFPISKYKEETLEIKVNRSII